MSSRNIHNRAAIYNEYSFWIRILSARFNPYAPLTTKWFVYGLLYAGCFTARELRYAIHRFAIKKGFTYFYVDYGEDCTIESISRVISEIKKDVEVYRVGDREIEGKVRSWLWRNRKSLTIYHIPPRDAEYVPQRFFGSWNSRYRKVHTRIRRVPRRFWVAGLYRIRMGEAGEQNRLVWLRVKGKGFRNPKLKDAYARFE